MSSRGEESHKGQPTVKDFLLYLVKKGILPKQAVQECRDRKQDALQKGYTISVKDILLEQGYIADENEYRRLWQDVSEDFRIRSKIADHQSDMRSFLITESILEELLSEKQFDRERYPEVSTDIILTVESRWKGPKKKAPKPEGGSDGRPGKTLQSLSKKIKKSTMEMTSTLSERIKESGGILKFAWGHGEIGLLVSIGVAFLWALVLAHKEFGLSYGKKYFVQRIEINIPSNPMEKDKLLQGKIEEMDPRQYHAYWASLNAKKQ